MKKYKSCTPGFRGRVVVKDEFVQDVPPLFSKLNKQGRRSGRNASGKVTVRHRGGGAKQKLRQVDFGDRIDGVRGVVKTIEYCPGRSANVSQVFFADGRKEYMLAVEGLSVGSVVSVAEASDIKLGHRMQLCNIPVGTVVHDVANLIDGPGVFARSAGAGATLVAKSGKYATIKLPSGEVRLIHALCFATIGQVGNLNHRNRKLGKAGATRWSGRRPSVRGSVMNPCDHPHGGGEGKAPVGRSGPLTPWGKPALGKKTRRPGRSNKMIVSARKGR